MCFGGGDDSSSKEMIKIQKEEIAEAKRVEAERVANIQKGLKAITGKFEGERPTREVTKAFDWGTYTPASNTKPFSASDNVAASGVPEGYTVGTGKVTIPGTSGKAGAATMKKVWTDESGNPLSHARYVTDTSGGTSGTAARTITKKGFYGPDGVFHPEDEAFDVTTTEEYGDPTGGFDETFYNKFKQGMLNKDQPEVAKQYADAREELAYRLFRAGQGRGSVAAQETANLYEQNLNRTGEVLNKADTAAADLKTRVEKERQALIAQLYSTEDPTMAANNAISAVQNISAVPPDISPLGALFDIASIGGGALAQGYGDAKFRSSKSWLPSDDASRNVS